MSDFFIKLGYVDNLQAISFDPDTPEVGFWTAERLQTASDYQHYVYRVARRILQKKHLTTVADVGCGPAVKTKLFFEGVAKEIALFDQESIRSVAEDQLPPAKFTVVNLEICKPVTDGLFDVVICSDVIEHLRDPLPCIDLCKSLAAKAGYIVFSTPERDQLRGKECLTSGHPQHVREWNSSEFRKLLESRGLVVESELLLPAKRLSKTEAILRTLSLNLLNARNWKSCQVKVCRL